MLINARLLLRPVAAGWRLLADESYARVFLTLVLSAKVVMALGLFYALGFSGVSADEYTRSISAMEWAENPNIVTGETAWLPFQLYLNGCLLKLIPDPLWIPRVTIFIASCILIVFFYKLVRQLFASAFAAAASTLGLLLFPWYAWMSLTAMLELYFLAAIIVGLYYSTLWVTDQNTKALYIAASAFFLATGFHYQAWMILAAIDLVSLWVAWKLLRARNSIRFGHQLIAYLLAHAYIVLTIIFSYLDTGHPLAFLESHNEYSKWYYDGYAAPWINKLLYYPKNLLAEANPIFGIVAICGATLALARGRQFQVMLILGGLVLLGYSLLNIWSVPPTTAPGRFSLAVYIFVLPYYGFALAILQGGSQPSTPAGNLRGAQWLALGVIVGGSLWGLNQIRHVPMTREMNNAVEAGYEIRDLLQQYRGEKGYVVELEYWQFLGVKLTAGHYDRQYFDRPFLVYQRHLPSLLQNDPQKFASFLRDRQVVAMAFHAPELVALAEQFGEIVSRNGDWVVFHVSFGKRDNSISPPVPDGNPPGN